MERRGPLRHFILAAAIAIGPAASLAGAQAADRALQKLEAEVAKKPNSMKAQRNLGIKLYELKRYADAKTALATARQLDAKDAVSALYAGFTAEAMGDLTAAREAYAAYLQYGKTRSARRDVTARLAAISREELKAAAKQAVANEQRLAGQQAPGNTVAVLPFHCNCGDSTYFPLSRGIAELVVSDLARSPDLRVLERDRMQAIADEIRLTQASQVDAATATRAGKLIAAGKIVNGQINLPSGAQQVNLTGAVVNANQGGTIDGNPSANGPLDAIFQTERDFVLATFTQLGVTVSPEIRRELEARRVPNFQAFLAYSRGLMAEDEGRLDDAVQLFESARSLDPGFGAALQRAQAAAAARSGSQVTSASVQQGMRNSSEGQAVSAANRGSTVDVSLNLTLNNVIGDVNPTITNSVQNNTGGTGGTNTPQSRDASSETTGTDQPAQRTGQVTIVIRKP
jgi:TolB-like protein